MAPLIAAGLVAAFASLVSGAVVGTPATGKVWLGAWLDTAETTPSAWNAEMGLNASSFQFAQTLPVTPYDYVTGIGGMMNQTLIENTGTDASIFLTVYPQTILSLSNVTDIQLLAQQILFYQSAPYNRKVLLRYAPEMQGNWMLYGQSPTAFVSGWKTMYTTIKSIAPDTVIVWSPNTALGYPYGTVDLSTFSTADQALLDTNNDGTLDINDDAYAPYYPGAAYVDWAGLSLYEKGAYPYVTNSVMAAGTIQANLDGNSDSVDVYTPFYSTYCKTPARSCVISEAGAAFKTNTTNGVGIGQEALEQNWWRQGWTNATFWEAYPQIKMFHMFEYEKVESSDGNSILNDYRVTYNATLRTQFIADIASEVPAVFAYAASQVIYTGSDGTAQPSVAPTEPQGYTAPAATSTSSTPASSAASTAGAASAASTTSPAAGAASPSTSASLFSGAGKLGGELSGLMGAMMVSVALGAAGVAGVLF